MISLLLATSFLAAPAPSAGQGAPEQPTVPAAITGVAAAPDGSVFVSPAQGTGKHVLQIAVDGSLMKSWPIPEGAFVEVTDSDASGRPVVVDARLGKVWVLGEDKPVKEIALADIKSADVKALAPIARSGPGNTLYVPALDGTFVLAIGEVAEPRSLRTGNAFPLTDFDVSADGRMAMLDSVTAKVRLHAAEGTSIAEISARGTGSPDAAYYALCRYAPSGELWLLELPAPDDEEAAAPSAAFVRLDAKGKRLSRIDKHGDTPIGPVAGFAAVDDGVWGADLDGGLQRLAKDGKRIAAFDGTPAPPGMDWAEKRRLEKIADAPESASIADVVGAMAVTRGRKNGEDLYARLKSDAKASIPLIVTAVAKDQIDGGLLATIIASKWPETGDELKAALEHENRDVRASAVAVLRAPAVTGFDAELAAAAKDPDRQVRGSALLVIRLAKWNEKTTMPLVVARLSDEDPDVALLAASILAERLSASVGAVANVIKDPKANDATRTIASRTLLLDVPGGERLNPLPVDKRAPIRALALSPDARVQRIGALALTVHGDEKAPAAIEKAWAKMETGHKRLAMAAWAPSMGDPGAETLGRLLAKEKNQDLRPELLQALARTSGGIARKKMIELATKAGGDERDRAVAVGLTARKLSDAQITALAAELPSVGSELRRAIVELCAVRGVTAAGPKIAELALSEDRQTAFIALYRLGSKDGVAFALANIAAGRAAPEIEYAYLGAVGGLPEEVRPQFRELSKNKGPLAPLAAEALARSGDAFGLPTLVDAAKADRYGQSRDGAIAGAIAALGAEGKTAAVPLLTDANAATRENAALALALQGGDSCRELGSWARSPATAGIAIPTAFFALASCGEITAAHELYRRSLEAARTSSDPVFQTAAPDTFAALLAKMLRQPDFRPKAGPVLGAVSGLPKPVVQAVAQAIASDLHPDVAGAAMKHVY